MSEIYIPNFNRMYTAAATQAIYPDGSSIIRWDDDGKYIAVAPNRFKLNEESDFDTAEQAASLLADLGYGPAAMEAKQ